MCLVCEDIQGNMFACVYLAGHVVLVEMGAIGPRVQMPGSWGDTCTRANCLQSQITVIMGHSLKMEGIRGISEPLIMPPLFPPTHYLVVTGSVFSVTPLTRRLSQ